ncbi:MAG: hypothetical protein IKX14_08165 [Neisseriaceae bacterium]|nr:hypothetical protein [Neisseriaceae bacterium]
MRAASGVVNVNYLFDSAGRWIAFRKRRYVFDRDSRWIGWTPWDDNEVYSPNGSYLGTITYGNRLYCYSQRDDRGAPGTIEPPPFPGTYSEPTSPGRAVLLPWAHDLDFSWHAELDWSSDLGAGVEQNMIFGHQPDIRSLRNPSATTEVNEHKLPALDLDAEFSSLSEDSSKNEIKTSALPKDKHSRDDDRDDRRVRSRSRYDDEDDYDDDRGYRSRPRSRYDEDDYDDRDRRSRPRSRYDEDDYDDRDRRARPRSRYEDDYDDDRGYRSRPRSRYEDDYDDDRDYRSRSRSRYDDEEDDRGYRSRPRSRYEDDYDDDRYRRPRGASRRDDDDYDDHYLHRPAERTRKEEDDNELNRKKEIDRLRLVISKHAAKKADDSDDDIALLQPLKKTN